MRSPWFAASSLALLLALGAHAETRPHYGGTLRIETRQAINVLPPADETSDTQLGAEVSSLMFEAVECGGRGCTGLPGPFKVGQFVPGKKLTLIASDEYRGGQPFLDSIEITMGRAPRDQMLDLQLGRADVIDVPAESIRRAQQDGMRVMVSAPTELIAVVFRADEPRLREALSLSVDRAAIFNVLLGRQGAPSAALLPTWMTGYAFAFDSAQDISRARLLHSDSRRTQPLTLTYDPQDSLTRAIAERIALDARAAGLQLTPTTSIRNPDAKLVRIMLLTTDPRANLAAIAAALGAPAPQIGNSPEEWYAAERKMKDDLHIVPIVHLPNAYGLSPRVKDWPASKTGEWSLDQVWLEQKP